jgi:hypothetical protein
LGWVSENFQTVAHLATEILNISCAKSVAGHEELCKAIEIFFERAQLATAAKVFSLNKYIYLI